jgi:hypothetical protein
VRRALLAAALGAGCTAITGDFSDVISLLYTGPAAPSVLEGDTVTLTAVALDRAGDPLPDVPVIWRVLEPDTAPVGLTLDSTTGLVTGVFAGRWRVQGDADGLRTNLIQVTVNPVADSIAALQDTVTLPAGDADTPSLTATVYDLPPSGVPTTVAGAPVRFTLVSPAPGTPEAATLALAPPGGEPGSDPHTVVDTTTSGGLAFATLRRVGSGQPGTAVVEAVALAPAGGIIPGTPARFTVLIVNN